MQGSQGGGCVKVSEGGVCSEGDIRDVINAGMRPINLKLARPFVQLFMRTPLTANHITTLSLAAGLAAAWWVAQGSWGHAVVGALFLQLCYILDNCDGEIARRKGQSSAFGSWYDTVVDLVVHAAFFAGMAVGVYHTSPAVKWVALGWSASVGVLACYGVVMLEKWRNFGSAMFEHHDVFGPRAYRTIDTVVREISRGDFSHVALIAALFGWMPGLLWAAAIGSHVFWISDLAINWEPIVHGHTRS